MADQSYLTGESPPSSPRRASMSLQAAATMNAGLQNEVSRGPSSATSSSAGRSRQSPSSSRRRSTVLMNLQVNDPNVPAPGEMVSENEHNASNANGVGPSSPRPSNGSPMMLPRDRHHSRTPSLGELHQELEEEQEAQVNRLLTMIRQQQLQLQQLQAAQGNTGTSTDDASAISDRSNTQNSQSASTPQSGLPIPSGSMSSQSGLPVHPGSISSQSPRNPHPRSSFDIARADLRRRSRTPSRGTSQGASPRLRAASISAADMGDGMTLSGRDESAFYQAETQMLVRENQMLKHRVRELEKQLSETQGARSVSREPSVPSLLSQTGSTEESTASRGGTS